MTEFHFFSAPTSTSPGTLNPVYELLDFPIVMGGADDIVLTGPAPERPLVDGREVSDPRLVKALSKPIELDRAEVLDRSAKLAGVLRTMGIDPESGIRLTIAEDVPPTARALSILAAARIGVIVDARQENGRQADGVVGEEPAEAGDGPVVRIHAIETQPVEPGRASVKVTRSRFEGVGATLGEQTANLDQAMRDSRVESAEVVPLTPERPLVLTSAGVLDARASHDWLRAEVLPEA
ncbi:hypothetical protein ACH82I_17160 [Brevibacterium sp. GP-SGM9]|uniref:hypothetical protein n=1 Tax=unclassified Brevibacterium TaxID=2614124 RepID=UPI001E2983BE|nr:MULTISPECIES: hypothetical protein [unclassified Brevibacterium]MCD1285922.1 hypothetical protein [Brevibacterium sp. CCUG 69071]MDK8434987.1 hypothetical protein [Brevibacterium sp. H-BE7]